MSSHRKPVLSRNSIASLGLAAIAVAAGCVGVMLSLLHNAEAPHLRGVAMFFTAAFWVAVSLAPVALLFAACLLCYRAGRRSDGVPQSSPPPSANDAQRMLQSRLGNKVLGKREQILAVLSGEIDALFGNRLEVRHLMTEKVESVAAEAPVSQVVRLMAGSRVRHVLVCERNGPLVGIISDRDIHARLGATAGDIMSRDPITIGDTTPVGYAVETMLNRNFSCLPVYHGKDLCGVITTADVILGMRCALDVLEQLAIVLHEEPAEGTLASVPAGA
jgi:CBS domain-containing protein